MFNLFKRKDDNPITNVFFDLSVNQKMSIINLLQIISFCDDDIDPREIKFLNTYIRLLGVRADNCLAYLKSEGYDIMFNDLRRLSESQKEFLVVVAWDMIKCDGRTNETEIESTMKFFIKIGINDDKFAAIIEKTEAILKRFL